MTCTEPAYAKLNLSLDILGRRSDGYHDMRMVMQSVTLRDTVTLEERGDGALSISTSGELAHYNYVRRVEQELEHTGEHQRQGKDQDFAGQRSAAHIHFVSLCFHVNPS